MRAGYQSHETAFAEAENSTQVSAIVQALRCQLPRIELLDTTGYNDERGQHALSWRATDHRINVSAWRSDSGRTTGIYGAAGDAVMPRQQQALVRPRRELRERHASRMPDRTIRAVTESCPT